MNQTSNAESGNQGFPSVGVSADGFHGIVADAGKTVLEDLRVQNTANVKGGPRRSGSGGCCDDVIVDGRVITG